MMNHTSTYSATFTRYNNIEWLRLIFAAQVMVVHVFHHIADVSIPLIAHFPGVPAFFFTSGFLIYASYLKSKSVSSYFGNRFLRLFPALFVVCLAALALVVAVKGTEHFGANLNQYLVWFFGQITLGQAYNPGMFRDIGVGVMNGSLWTITVEILFYLAVPVIVYLEKYFKHTLLVLFVLSFALYTFGAEFLGFEVAMGKSAFELLKLTPLVWGWMFLIGSLTYKYFDMIRPLFDKFWIAIVPLVLVILLGDKTVFLNSRGNSLGLVYFLLYVFLILYIAFSVKYIPLGFDLSYGIYIWHMVIVNLMLVLNRDSIMEAFLLTVGASAFSWFVVENPSLKLKKYSLLRSTGKNGK